VKRSSVEMKKRKRKSANRAKAAAKADKSAADGSDGDYFLRLFANRADRVKRRFDVSSVAARALAISGTGAERSSSFVAPGTFRRTSWLANETMKGHGLRFPPL